jgi:hypothetical protein
MLAADVVAWSDGGGQVAAGRKPMHGAPHVARALIGLARKVASCDLSLRSAFNIPA